MAEIVSTPRRKIGRPTKYRVEFCARAIECGKKGWTVAEIASSFNVSYQRLWEWEKQFPEFREAITRARSEALSWHCRKFRRNVNNRDFNHGLAKMIAQAQFPEVFRDVARLEHSGPGGNPIEISDVDRAEAMRLVREGNVVPVVLRN